MENEIMSQIQSNEDHFKHDFHAALDALNNGKLIQGSEFQSGLYVAMDDTGMAATFDVKDNNRRLGNLFVYKGLYRQRYRVFTVANEAIKD